MFLRTIRHWTSGNESRRHNIAIDSWDSGSDTVAWFGLLFGYRDIKLQILRQIADQVRSLEKQQRECSVDGGFVAELPGAVGTVFVEDDVDAPAVPVARAEVLLLIQHAHAFERPE